MEYRSTARRQGKAGPSRRHEPGIALTLALLLQACAGATLHLDSQPQKAEIFVLSGLNPASTEPKRIGETPLSISSSEIEKATGITGPLYIEFRKSTHGSARAFITDAAASDIRLQLALPSQTGLEDPDTVNSAVDLSFEAQRLTLIGRYTEALSKVKEAQKEAPLLAAPYEIEAGIYFLQKRLSESLDAYRTATRLNPGNPESLRMRKHLEATLGLSRKEASVRVPAAAKPAKAKEELTQ